MRKTRRIAKGTGDYFGIGGYYGDAVGHVLKGAGGVLTHSANPYAALGGHALSALGAAAGKIEDFLAPTRVGAAWRKFTGQGAYRPPSAPAAGPGYMGGIVSNSIVAGHSAPPPTAEIPTFSVGSNSVTISHKEYVGDIYAPTIAGVFQNRTFPLNPGLGGTFPWLAQTAANYEEYTLKQLIFTYRPSVTDFVSTNGQVGMLIMATQYNAADPPFASKQDMLEYDLSMDAKVTQHMYHGVECDPKKLSMAVGKYTRVGPPPPGEDVKTYDHGVLNIGVSNCPEQFNNQALGELWVSYTFEFRKPKFFTSRGLAIQRDTFIGRTSSKDGQGDGVPVNELLWAEAQQNRIGGRIETISTQAALDRYLAQPNLFFKGYAVGGALKLDMNCVGALLYTFPQDFSGTVQMTLTSTSAEYNPQLASWGSYPLFTNNGGYYQSDGTLAPLTTVWNTSFGGGLTAFNLSDLGKGVAMTGIADLWSRNYSDNVNPATTPFAWGPLAVSASSTAATTVENPDVDSTTLVTLHLNVISPTTSSTTTPNQVLFPLFLAVNPDGILPQDLKELQLDVSIYNGGQGAGGFNNTGALSNSRTSGLQLVNIVTQEPIQWPLGTGTVPNSA